MSQWEWTVVHEIWIELLIKFHQYLKILNLEVESQWTFGKLCVIFWITNCASGKFDIISFDFMTTASSMCRGLSNCNGHPPSALSVTCLYTTLRIHQKILIIFKYQKILTMGFIMGFYEKNFFLHFSVDKVFRKIYELYKLYGCRISFSNSKEIRMTWRLYRNSLI